MVYQSQWHIMEPDFENMGLILNILDDDVLNNVLTHIGNKNLLPLWLTCKGIAARRPVGGFATSVRSMYGTPNLLEWAMSVDCIFIDQLVELLGGDGANELKQTAVCALWNLARRDTYRAEILEVYETRRALGNLLALSGGRRSEETKEAAMALIRYIARSSFEHHRRIVFFYIFPE